MMLTQADQTSISTWETTVRTAGSLCSFGTNADEFMRDEFLFGLNDSFSGFRDDIFYRYSQRKPEDSPFTLAFVVSQAICFESAQKTNKVLTSNNIEEQVHYTITTNKTIRKPAGKFTRTNNQPCYFCGQPKHPREKCPARR